MTRSRRFRSITISTASAAGGMAAIAVAVLLVPAAPYLLGLACLALALHPWFPGPAHGHLPLRLFLLNFAFVLGIVVISRVIGASGGFWQ